MKQIVLLAFAALVVVATATSSSGNTFPYKSATGYFSPRRSSIPSSFDYIVVGGGAAGSVVASRLSEDSRNKVLLLERGSDTSNDVTFDVPRNWDVTPVSVADKYTFLNFHNEPVVNWNEAKARVSQGFALGGTTIINAEMFVRGHPNDFDRWASNYGATGWTFNEVLPFFKKIETNTFKAAINPSYHGTTGPLKVTPSTEQAPEDLALMNAAAAYGIPFNNDINGPNQLTSSLGGAAFHDMTISGGIRQNAYRAYIQPNLNRRNLYVVDSALVTKINFNNRKRATSVTWYDTLEQRVVTSYASSEIVISSGGIGTPKLLQLSGIGDSAHLESLGIDVVKHLPGVGQNLQDHPITNLGASGLGLPEPVGQTLNAASYNQWLVNKTGPYSSIGGRALYMLRTKYHNSTNDPRPDIEVIGGSPGSTVFGAVYLLHPHSRGYVKIHDNNPFVDPLPVGNNYQDPRDAATHCEGLRMLFNIWKTISPNVVLSTGPSDWSDGSCAYYITGAAPWSVGNSNTGNHWSGTARIGAANDANAVVDARLRVYGVTGLRVADASVFPEVTSGNTQAPTYMVGEKAAAMILEDN